MNFVELNKTAKEIALKNLDGKFDWQAFLVLSTAILNEERIGKPVDVVPDSKVDEAIQELLNFFADYINAKKAAFGGAGDAKESEVKLEKLLKQNVRILKEIGLTCDTPGEKDVYKKYMEEIRKMG